MSSIDQYRCLVTGASRGIGREIARRLAAAGAEVVAGYHTRAEAAESLVQEIVASGGRATAVQADVSRADEVAAMMTRALEGGPIDILINNAGLARPVPIDQQTEASWHEAIATNLTSAYLVTQAVLPGMRAKGWGRVVFLSSVAAQVGGVVGPHYAASKAGLHGLMHYYSTHLAKEGITSNIIAPALIDTDMVRQNPNASPRLIPVGRFGEPSEVADVVMMIVTNGYLTGQTINVNGGWYMT
jgi:3-oxoacyl-[acyl-carrier protein] reductase